MQKIISFIIFPAVLLCVAFLSVSLQEKSILAKKMEKELQSTRYVAEARKKLLAEAKLVQEAMEARKDVLDVVVTAYNAEEDQCDADPFIAASLRRVRPGTIAVSRDLFDAGWVFGKKVRIDGIGIFEINDLMNARYEKRIDIFMWDRNQAVSFGKGSYRAALLEI
ncbi:MAG: 3D domain-containing protein [Desulfovibrio sp.]